ncbi:hypothetical protein V2J09_007684 [Rumex salicifolius]
MCDERWFRSLVGGLIYLTHTRPDIAYCVSVVSRTKHIEVQHHYIRKLVADEKVVENVIMMIKVENVIMMIKVENVIMIIKVENIIMIIKVENIIMIIKVECICIAYDCVF